MQHTIFILSLFVCLATVSFSQGKVEYLSRNCRRAVWEDPRLNSESGRLAIVKEATYLAFAQLNCIGERSHIVKLFNYRNDESYYEHFYDVSRVKPQLKKAGFNPLFLSNEHGTLSIQVRYTNFNRKANVQSHILPSIKNKNCPYEYYDVKYEDGIHKRLGCNCELSPIKPFWQSTNVEINGKRSCYKEEISATIEIFTDVFDRGYLLIPNEMPFSEDVINPNKPVAIGRYAGNVTEAIIYLVLHELGHFEYFISNESKYPEFEERHKRLEPIGDSTHDEESAWEYASSVARACLLKNVISN